MRRSGPALALAGLWLVTAAASAQPGGSQADELFEKGVAEMEAGRLETGCPQIAESLRIDPRPGTTFTLAECEARWSKPSAALRHYGEYLAALASLAAPQQAKHAARKQKALEAVKRLEGQVAKLTLAPPLALSFTAEVSLDGVRVEPASLGKPELVDPGEHIVVVRASGREQSEKITLGAGESRTLSLQPVAEPKAPEAPGSASAPAPAPPPPSPSAPEPQRPGSTRATVMYAGAGLAAAGLLAGGIGGAIALSKKSQADRECVGLVCSRKGIDAVESGRSAALVGTIGFAAAAVGAGVAITLYLLDRREPASGRLSVTPAVGQGSGGLLVGGAF